MNEGPEQSTLDALAAQLGSLLLERGARVTTAESCTGGWIAQAITSVAGSSNWFECAFVSYSNTYKAELLGVDPMTLERHGAVSAETVKEMAAGAANRAGAEFAVAVSGVAGPGGGSSEKPVGTVWFGYYVRGRECIGEREVFSGGRRAVRAKSVERALNRLIELCG